MSNIFSFNRFGKYFGYELKNSAKKYGITAIVIALGPIIAFCFAEILHLIIDGSFSYNEDTMMITRGLTTAILFIYFVFFVPSKLYGDITDKRFGTNYVLVPCSTTEKWLSMVLVTIVVVPVVTLGLYLGFDRIMSAIFPNSYGRFIFTFISDSVQSSQFEEFTNLSIPFSQLMFLSYIQSLLEFLLGAIFFKKHKIAKTILVLYGIGMVSTLLLVVLAQAMDFTLLFNDEKESLLLLNNISTGLLIFNYLFTAVLLGLVFFRLKTIKH